MRTINARLAKLEKVESERLDRAYTDYFQTITNEELDRLESIVERRDAGLYLSPEDKSFLFEHNTRLTGAYQKIVVCDLAKV